MSYKSRKRKVVSEVQKEEPKLEIVKKRRANHPITF
jgi:hypothetical protein